MKTRSIFILVVISLLVFSACSVKTDDADVSIDSNGISVEKGGKKVNLGSGDGISIDTEDADVTLGEDGITVETTDDDDSDIEVEVGDDATIDEEGNTITIVEGKEFNATCEEEYQSALTEYAQDYSDCYGAPDYSGCGSGTTAKKDNLILIMDSSGSMAAMVGGEVKMDVAKEEAIDFLDEIDSDVNFGLVVYGHKGSNSTSDRTLSCKGIEEKFSLGVLNKTKATTAINSLKSTGWTPIADSLKKAQSILANYPSSQYNNKILLVSDGEETCGGNPASIASSLNASNIGVIINVIGFDVDSDSEEQLKLIAENGGGSYYTARNAAELESAMQMQADTMCFGEQMRDWGADMRHYGECQRRFAQEQRDIASVVRDKKLTCGSYIQLRYKEREVSIQSQLATMMANIVGGIPLDDDLDEYGDTIDEYSDLMDDYGDSVDDYTDSLDFKFNF